MATEREVIYRFRDHRKPFEQKRGSYGLGLLIGVGIALCFNLAMWYFLRGS